MKKTFLIVGGGHAGAQAVDTLRREGFDGRLVLIGDEAGLPYQRPPLSKKFLSGEITEERLPFRHQAFYDEHAVELVLGKRARRLDPGSRSVEVDGGAKFDYDRLLLCLGATSRRLSCVGAELAGVHYLRTIRDAAAIAADLKPGKRAVIIGGGYIGLETAATCRALGLEVTVLEMADRVMNRVVAPAVSDYFAAAHRAQGVKIICDTRVVALEGPGRVAQVVCADGSRLAADVVIIGVGALAVEDLAAQAGLRVDNGIVVDEHCRTADPAIFAAGDCANHPSPHYGTRVRLESVDNAFEQSKAAAQNMLDRNVVHDRVPWFWSDQFAHKLLIVGLAAGHDQCVTRGDPDAGGFSICYLKNRELIALEAVDDSKDFMAARKLIASRAKFDPVKLRDKSQDLRESVLAAP